MAKKVPHLTVRGGRFYFRMRVPLPLVAEHGVEVSKALGDVTKAQAEVMARELAGEYAAQFLATKVRLGLANSAPALPPASARPVASPEEARAVALKAGRDLLERDDMVRLSGRRSDLWDWWRSSLSDLDDVLVAALSGGDMRRLWHDFKGSIASAGLSLPDDSEDRRMMVHRWAMEQAKAVQGIRARDEGQPVETPAPVVMPSKAMRMRDVLDVWTSLANRPPKTIKAFTAHVAVFERMTGNAPLSSLRRADGLRFRDTLQQWAVQEKKTAAYADNILTSIKALANVARDREWMEANPFERLSVTKGGKEREPREPWTTDEMLVLFDDPLFARYELPHGDSVATKGGRDAAYWIPLIAAHTGARPKEICQLWTDDVSEGAGGLVMEIRANEARGQTLKYPASSWRAVPLHSELTRLGLREYLEATRRASGGKAGPLWPHLPTAGDNGAAGQFGDWFGHYKVAKGFPSRSKVLYSFRHTMETELAFAGASPTLVDAIVGHEGQGIGRKVYGATIRRDGERLRETVELLRYPMKLRRAYPERAS